MSVAPGPRIDLGPALSFSVFGGPAVVGADGSPVALSSGQWRVLAPLIELPNALVRAEAIKDRVWPQPDRGATQLLHTNISNIRRLLDQASPPGRPTALPRLAGGYRLDVAPLQLDTLRVERLAAAGQAAFAAGALAAAREWFGAALQLRPDAGTDAPAAAGFDLAFLVWFAERFRGVRSDLVDVRLRLAEHRSLVPELAALVHADPTDPHATEALAVALHRCGRGREALTLIARWRRALIEVGMHPGQVLRDTESAILDGRWAGPPPSPPRQRDAPAAAVVSAAWPERPPGGGLVGDSELRLVVAEHGGRIGDGPGAHVHAAFASAERAVEAAGALLHALAAHTGLVGRAGVAIVGQRGGGRCPAHLAAVADRLLATARPAQVLVADRAPGPAHGTITVTSTRRLASRPSSVSLGATGIVSP